MKKTRATIVLTAVLAAVLVAAYAAFNHTVTAHLRENAVTRLGEIVAPNIISFELQVAEQMRKVETFADHLGQVGQLGDPEQLNLLQSAVRHNGLSRCAIAFADGSFVTHEGEDGGNVSGDPFFLAGMAGQRSITEPQPSAVDPDQLVILFTAPIYRDGAVAGVMIYSYPCDGMDQMFNLRFLEGQGRMSVVSGSGALLMGGNTEVQVGESLVDQLRGACTHRHHPPEDCLALAGEAGACTLSLADGGQNLLVSYQRLGFNGWYMLSTVPESAAAGSIYSVSRDQRLFSAVIILSLSLYAAALTLNWLRHRKNTDKSTGALTLEGFQRRAHRLLRRAGSGVFVLVKLDVKNFKLINRVYDFATGDRVIRSMAAALAEQADPAGGLFARMGADGFVLLLPYRDRPTLDAQRAAFIAGFQARMGPDFTTRVEFPTGQYIITEQDYPHPDVGEMLEKANFAHRAAKQGNWGHYIVDYVEDLEREALLEKAIEDKMSSALRDEEFQLYLQPKYRVSDETICGAEALVRWEINGRFYLHPSAFIPILERNGFIVKLDMFMFEQAVLRIRAFLDSGTEPVPISVNFSRAHLANASFVEGLCAVTDRHEVPRRYLEVELTESAVFENLARIVELIGQLHAAGFTLSMDDFGSGYSCLALLKELKVDVLKLDKCFFDDCADPQRAKVVVSHVMGMARDLGVTTVAEGVEQREQVDLLRELGCDIIQGFYYAKPLPAAALTLDENANRAIPTGP